MYIIDQSWEMIKIWYVWFAYGTITYDIFVYLGYHANAVGKGLMENADLTSTLNAIAGIAVFVFAAVYWWPYIMAIMQIVFWSMEIKWIPIEWRFRTEADFVDNDLGNTLDNVGLLQFILMKWLGPGMVSLYMDVAMFILCIFTRKISFAAFFAATVLIGLIFDIGVYNFVPTLQVPYYDFIELFQPALDESEYMEELGNSDQG